MIEIGQRKEQEREKGDSITGRGNSKGERSLDDYMGDSVESGEEPERRLER